MGRLIITLLLLTATVNIFAQTCTISCGTTPCTVQWSNAGPTCANGGTIVIPAGVTLEFDTNADTWTGTEIQVFGTLSITAPGQATINSNITVKSGGVLSIGSKLNIGGSTGCGYNLSIESGGLVDIAGSTPDRLNICGTEIARGGTAGCNSFPDGPLPYCEPTGGFSGPIVLNESGLPIQLLYFKVSLEKNKSDHQVFVEWATEEEENFDHFEIERANSDLKFSKIKEVSGAGYNTSSVKKYSTYDNNPLVGIGYYRLKAVDVDGTYEYFQVKSIHNDGGRKLIVSPNPASGKSFTYSINFDPGPYDRVVLISQVGTELFSAPVKGIENEITFDSPIKSGAYLLRYISPDFQQTSRVFIKE